MRKSFIVFGLILVWLTLVIAFYFIAHKPADSQQLAALANWLPGLSIGILLTISAAGLGYRFLRSWGSADQRVTLSIALGLGIFSASTLLLGLAGIVRSDVAWLLVIVGLVVGWRSLRPWWRDLVQSLSALRPASLFTRFCAAYCGVVLAVALLQALAPVTAWDGLAYHLKGPQLYEAAGGFAQPIDLPYLGFPQFGEMLYLQVQLLGGQTPSLMHWIFAAITGLLVAGESQRLWNEKIGWAAAAIYLSAETVVLEAGWPYIDLMLAFHVFAAYVCLELWQSEGQTSRLIGVGVFTGFAMATKYLAGLVVVAFALILIVRARQQKLRALGLFVMCTVITAAPWFLKNWIVFGNPVYPMLLGGPYWDSVRSQAFSRIGTGLAFNAPMGLLTVPWDMTIWGVEGKIGYAATIGPLFLVLVPITLIGWRYTPEASRRALGDAVFLCAVACIGWWVGLALSEVFLQSRLLVPLFPLLALIGAGAFAVLGHFDRPALSLRRISTVLVSITLIATAAKVVLDFAGSGVPAVLAGRQSKDAYLADNLGWYYLTMQALNELGPSAHVLFLWEPRSLYCEVDCRPDSLIDRWWHARRTLGSVEQIAAQWRREGVQYVLLHRAGYQAAIALDLLRPTADDQQALDQLVENHLEFVHDYGGQYQLYRWRE